MIFTRLQKLSKNVGDLGKIIYAMGFEKLPKVQQIAQSGHTGSEFPLSTTLGIGQQPGVIIRAISHVLHSIGREATIVF